MTRSSTSPSLHLPSSEFAPRPFDCDVLGSAKKDDLEVADDTFGFDLVLASFRKKRPQPALRQDTVNLSAAPPMAGPGLFRSLHSVLDLAGDGTTLLTPTSLPLDKTGDGDGDATPVSARVLGLAGDGATPMARTSKRLDKTGLLAADTGVVPARVLGDRRDLFPEIDIREHQVTSELYGTMRKISCSIVASSVENPSRHPVHKKKPSASASRWLFLL